MASAQIEDTIPVGKERFFEVVTRYEDYPQFVDSVTRVSVERKGPGQARVTYHVSLMKDVTYVLDLKEDIEKGRVSWTLVESDVFKKNEGGWDITPNGEGAVKVRYFLDVEFKIPVPGFILKKLVSGNLPSMLKSFKERALGRG